MIFAQTCTDQVVVMVESIVEKLRKVGQLRVFNAAGQLIHQQQLQPLVEHQIIAHNGSPASISTGWRPLLLRLPVSSSVSSSVSKIKTWLSFLFMES